MQTYRRELQLPASAPDVSAWHAEPEAFDRLVPPWLDVEVVERYDRLEDRRDLDRMFAGRHEVTRRALASTEESRRRQESATARRPIRWSRA